MSLDSQYNQNAPLPVSEEKLSNAFVAVMTRVYLWMTLGLALTTVVSLWVLNTPVVLDFFYTRPLALIGFMCHLLDILRIEDDQPHEDQHPCVGDDQIQGAAPQEHVNQCGDDETDQAKE